MKISFFLQIFTTNLKSKSKLGYSIEFCEFDPSGNNFVLSGAKAVEVWSIEKAGVIKTIPCESKPTSLCWLDENNLLIGLNDGKLVWDHLEKDEVKIESVIEFKHTNLANIFLFFVSFAFSPLHFKCTNSE